MKYSSLCGITSKRRPSRKKIYSTGVAGDVRIAGNSEGGSMKGYLALVRKVDGWMNTVAEFVLFFMMMLTVADVILRSFGSAILGTYELVAVAGAIVVGFSVPQTSWDRGHVYVDFLIENRSTAVRNAFNIGTRIVGTILFAFLSYRLMIKGIHLQKTGEVSLTLHIPYYPAAMGLALCFFVECFTLIGDVVKIFTVETEHE
jgi:TRAP-type C4-dicarboxylate transport system permease small subunit